MKKLFIYSVIITITGLFLSCKDDDHSSPGKKSISNSFEYEGKSYDLDHGYEGPAGKYEEYDLWNIYLMSSSITAEGYDFAGTGNFVRFIVSSTEESNVLPEGNYSLDNGTFVGLIAIDYTLPDKEGEKEILLDDDTLKEMTVEVSRSNDKYTIEFTGILKDGDKKISGAFSGELEAI